jgi:hypothetical protein
VGQPAADPDGPYRGLMLNVSLAAVPSQLEGGRDTASEMLAELVERPLMVGGRDAVLAGPAVEGRHRYRWRLAASSQEDRRRQWQEEDEENWNHDEVNISY